MEDTYPIESAKELAIVEISRFEGRALVSFAAQHAIADGRLGYHWAKELWGYYTALVGGESPVVKSKPVPLSPETLLEQHGVKKAGRGVTSRVEQATPFAFSRRGQGKQICVSRERIRLTAETTTRLLARARAQQQTMHSLVAGAIAVVERRWLQIDGDQAVDLAVSSPVDIRGRLGQPVPLWGATNVLGIVVAVVTVHPTSDPLAVGAELLQQIREDIEAGVAHQHFLLFADAIRKEPPKIPSIAVTNYGALEPVPTPPGLEVLDCRIGVYFDWNPILAMIEASGSRDGAPGISSTYLVTGYDGQLGIYMELPLPPERAHACAQEVEALLVEIASRA